MKQLLFIFLFLYICFNVACISQKNDKKGKINLDIPDPSDLMYASHKETVKEFNLPNLELGVDSFELRFWKKILPYTFGEIIIIKKDSTKKIWEGYYYSYWSNPEAAMKIDSFKVKKVEPKSGWSKFLDEINKEKIHELPSQNKIPHYESRMDDGVIWEVEIATTNSYKYYAYHNPHFFTEKFWQCKQMLKIAVAFDEEFPFRPPIDVEALIEKNNEK